MFPSLGGYGGHWGQQQVRGDMHSSPAPPAPQGAHHGPWPLARGVRAQGTPNSPQLGRWSANFLWVAARRLARGSCREAAPETPWGRKVGRGGCCCGWERRPPRHTRAPPGSAASEVSALTLPLLWLNCLWVSPTGLTTPSFLSLLPDPRIFKGAARYFSCSTLRSPDVGLASSAH